MSDAVADTYCWPHSSAANTTEIKRLVLRIGMFQRRGLTHADAETLAEKCLNRDRDIGARDMRACIECKHWQFGGTCAAKQAPAEKTMFQRCPAFGWQVPRST